MVETPDSSSNVTRIELEAFGWRKEDWEWPGKCQLAGPELAYPSGTAQALVLAGPPPPTPRHAPSG